MIEQIRLTNFQTHEKLIVDFDPHITTIVGTNDVGKSAILRALRWLCLNRPSGEGFRKWNTKKTSVRLKVDGSIIIRRRGSSNSYAMDGQEYRAFGQNVPAAIADILNLTENNFQGQFDNSFWLTEPPSQVAKSLNQIINLEVIDNALEFISSESRRAKTTVEVSKHRLEQARKKKQSLSWVPEVVKKIEKLEEHEREIRNLREKKQVLSDLIENAGTYKQQASNALPAMTKGRELLEKAKKIRALQKRVDSLKDLIEEIKTAKERSCRTRELLIIQKDILRKVKKCPACGSLMS